MVEESKEGSQKEGADGGALLDVFAMLDIEPVRGEGAFIFTADGRRFLDFYGGHAVALLGYGHQTLIKTLSDQAQTLFFQSNLVPLAVRERAARALLDFGPDVMARVFFVNSGAEANENALRLAFRTTGRKVVVAVEGAFHGRTAGAATVTAGSERWNGFPNSLFDVRFVPFDDVEALDAAVDDDVAAVIIEPVQGVAGARAVSSEFLARAEQVAKTRGAKLILDEVQCGMGRTGWAFAAQAYGVNPDILTVAKGLAGGFPAGAVLVSKEIADTVNKGDLGSTFGGGPMAAALIEAVIGSIVADGLMAKVRRLSTRLMKECLVGPVTAVQGMGFLIGLRTTRPAKEILAQLRTKGILAGGSSDSNVVRLLPPLILEDEHVDMLVEALSEIEP